MISISNLSKDYGTGPVVRDVSFSVPEGSFVVLLGPSGCGKSTMLRMLAGLEQPTGGSIHFDKTLVSDPTHNLAAERRGVGLVFQSYALWPHMTVAGNIDWPLKVAGIAATERRKRTTDALAMMGIGDLAERYTNEISGGQQQRVALARMIAPRPRVMLFDEPLSNLDAALRVEMRHELSRLHAETGATSVYVTHDQVEAMTLATHVAVFNRGRIEQFAPPMDLLNRPASAFVARFIGSPAANLIPIRDGAWFGRLYDPVLGGRTGEAMVRPEDMGIRIKAGAGTLGAKRLEVIVMAGQLLVTGLTEYGARLSAIVSRDTQVPETFHFVLPTITPTIFPTAEI